MGWGTPSKTGYWGEAASGAGGEGSCQHLATLTNSLRFLERRCGGCESATPNDQLDAEGGYDARGGRAANLRREGAGGIGVHVGRIRVECTVRRGRIPAPLVRSG